MRNYLYIGLIFLVFSCSKSDTDVQEFGYDYYPVIKGKYVVYNVEELIYNDFDNSIDTNIFQLKELMDSATKDIEGRSIVQLKRFTRVSDTLEWEFTESWFFYKGSERLEITEGNTVFVKMAFPLRRSKSWDGNARNTLDTENYTVLNLDLKIVMGTDVFDKTTRINHRSNVNLIEEQVKEEVYAADVGLIELRDIDLKYDIDGEIFSGFSYSQTYLEHGIE